MPDSAAEPRAPLVLASASPRRLQLLATLGLRAEVRPADLDETVRPGEAPRDYVQRLAGEKAQVVAARLAADDGRPVIGADTSVVIGGQILGKPRDARDFERQFASLSGAEHTVLSAVAVVARRLPPAVRLAETRVWLRESSRAERAAYWASGEPADKAGGYAIQGLGAVFVERIEGNFATVMGLPVAELTTLLALHGIDPLGAHQETT